MGRRSGRRRTRTTTATPRGLSFAALAICMALGPLLSAASGPKPEGSPRGVIVHQAGCPAELDAADSPGNWGALDTTTNALCDLLATDDERTANWGSVPVEVVTVQFTVEGTTAEVIQLPETVGQAAGEGGGSRISSPSDPKWAPVNQWNEEILAAQQRVFQETGVLVPPNVIKAIIMVETGGVMPTRVNSTGEGGLMRIGPRSVGASRYDLGRNRVDPAYSIFTGTFELALRYLDSGRQPWDEVVTDYFSGRGDALRRYRIALEELEAAGRPVAVREGGMTTATGVNALWGNIHINGAPPVISQEFGPTNFSVYVRPEWYSYALAYGFSQPGHTGLDVAIAAGTPLYAPLDSSVICAGTGNGTGEDSCAAFLSAYGGPTSGRLQLRLPNGDMLILGHVNVSIVRPGERVQAGQQIGLSGGFNGDHVHVEYRVRDGSTSSGWRIIDPRGPLSGVDAVPTPAGPLMMPTMAPTTAPVTATAVSPTATTSASPVATTAGSPMATVSPSPSPTASATPATPSAATPVIASPVGTVVAPDQDGDELTANQEETHGTDPENPDSDGDGLRDNDEGSWGTNPLDDDSDDDGLSDGAETNQHGSDPLRADTDEDGVSDGEEVAGGSDPTDPASVP